MKKKMLISACAASLLALALAGCTQSTSQQADYIGADAAKAIALEAAGIGEADATFTSAELENRNNTAYYEVDFTAGGQEYDYDIDALTGTVIQHSQKAADGAANANSGGTSTGAAITEDRAREIALEHVGLTADQVTFLRSNLDYDDGRQCYDVEFYTADYKEYDYEIDAATGEIVSYDYDAEGYQGQSQSGGTTAITADRAKEIALAEVPGATANDIYEFETDRDDGRLEYEGTIYYNGTEYDFVIDGYSGAIRGWDVEHHG